MPRPLLHLVGTFFGTGLAPFAPATVASLAWAALWWLAWRWWGPIPVLVQLVVLAVVTAVGVRVAGELERIHGEDPSLVVIDEIAGMVVTYLGVSGGAPAWITGFVWFRFFDIVKPFGLRRLERLGGGGGVGIMADDIGAGALACVATHVSIRLLGWGP